MKNIIITGASRGIGKELAKKFMDAGHQVLALSRNTEALKELGEIFLNENFRYAGLDLVKSDEIENVLDYIYDWEQVDVVFNNAGQLINKPFIQLSKEDFLSTWQVNFLAPALLIQALMPKLTRNSHIVNISTMGAVQGSVKFGGLAAYSSSKAALCNLTELLAAEFGTNGPSINCVALGSVQTEMLEQAFPGYEANLSSEEISDFLMEFGLNGNRYFNGKILPCSASTP